MPIHRDEFDSAIFEREETRNVLSLVARASRNAKHGVSVTGGVAREPQLRSVNRAIANLRIGAEAIEARTATVSNCTVGKLESIPFRCIEFLGHSFPFRVALVD